MNKFFRTIKEFHDALQAVAAEAGVPSSLAITSTEEEIEDSESHWQMRFNQGGPVVNTCHHVDIYADENEDRSFMGATLLASGEKGAAEISAAMRLSRSILFDLRERLYPDYMNTVVETPEGFVWRITAAGETRELPVELHTPENHTSEAGDYAFDLDTEVANKFFAVKHAKYGQGEWCDYEIDVERALNSLAVSAYWFSGDSDSFGPLVRCARITLANGIVLHASYG